MKIHLAADHAGFALKESIKSFLEDHGYQIVDHGAYAFDEADDYPEIIAKAARALAESPDDKGIIFGGSGQGEAIMANRFKGVRAIVYYGNTGAQIDSDGSEIDIIASSRLHNDANILSLGARFLTEDHARECVLRWLETSFEQGERHMRRIKALDTIISDKKS